MNLQESLLNYLRKTKITVTIYLANGIPIKGRIIAFDNFIVVMQIKDKLNIIYKHSISTVIPDETFQLKELGINNEPS